MECGNNPAPLDTCGWTGGDDGHYDCGGQGEDPGGAWSLECDEALGEVAGPPPEIECTVGETVQVGCGGVSFSGCCTAALDLVFCEGGEILCALHCAQLPSPLDTCGWKQAGETGFYDCGGDGIDPSGQNPIYCPDWTPDEDVITDGGDPVDTWGCPGLPVGGCCDGAALHYCDDGADAVFDCTEMAADPVFGAYVFCGLDEATGEASCLNKEDPNPPACEVLPEVSPEPGPPVGDAVGDAEGETMDGPVPDLQGDVDRDGAPPRDGVPPRLDGAAADKAWTWPDVSVPPGKVGGGGGKGCVAAPDGAAPPLLLLLLALVASQQRLRGALRRSRAGP